MSVTPESAEVAVEVMLVEMRPYLEKVLEDELATQGLDMTLEEAFEAMGTTMDELLEEYIDRDSLVNTMVEGSARSGRYEAKSGKLYFSDSVNADPDKTEYEPYSFEGETLLLTEDMGGKSVTMRLNRVK